MFTIMYLLYTLQESDFIGCSSRKSSPKATSNVPKKFPVGGKGGKKHVNSTSGGKNLSCSK